LKVGEKVAIQALWDCLEEIHFLQLMKVFITENAPGSELQLDAHIQLEGTQLATVDRKPLRPSER
jgi:hypothetical protein